MNDAIHAPVTVIGLGPMGRALAGAFLANGHATTVWNRTPAKADDLVARGAQRADTPADAIAASPLTVVCLLDYGAVRAVLDPAGDAATGRTLVTLTSGAPRQARETAAWAADHGVDYLDGAIMTPVETIGQPTAAFLLSGSPAVHEAVRDTLASLGGTATYLGEDPGRASAHDVALLDVFWTAMSGYVHALALARAEGIAATELASHAHGIATILPPIMDELARHVDAGEYPGDDSNLVSAAAAMEHIIDASRTHGIDASVLSAVKAAADRAIAAGHGDDAFSRLAAAPTPRSR